MNQNLYEAASALLNVQSVQQAAEASAALIGALQKSTDPAQRLNAASLLRKKVRQKVLAMAEKACVEHPECFDKKFSSLLETWRCISKECQKDSITNLPHALEDEILALYLAALPMPDAGWQESYFATLLSSLELSSYPAYALDLLHFRDGIFCSISPDTLLREKDAAFLDAMLYPLCALVDRADNQFVRDFSSELRSRIPDVFLEYITSDSEVMALLSEENQLRLDFLTDLQDGTIYTLDLNQFSCGGQPSGAHGASVYDWGLSFRSG